MSALKKSSLHKFSKNTSADPELSVDMHKNPFDSDDKFDNRKTIKSSGRTSSEPSLFTSDEKVNPFYDGGIKDSSSSRNVLSSAAKNRYKNGFRDSGGLENQTVQELENYAVYKAEETTMAVNNCLKISEDMREDATKTLVALHQQGEQITRTHAVAADMDHDLSRGEKLLGSLGGIFSKTWKPKKTRPIAGPMTNRDDPTWKKGNHLEQREKLGLASASGERSKTLTALTEPTNGLEEVQLEKVKQDDALTDLSNILGELKDMAIEMGSEIERQNNDLDYVQGDVEELNFRVKGANQRTRRLLGK